MPINLFKKIEDEKSTIRNLIFSKGKIDIEEYKKNGTLLYSSYWILYVIHELAVYKKIDIILDNSEDIIPLYPIAAQIIKYIWEEETKNEKDTARSFLYEQFFKKSKPMKYIDIIFDSARIKEYIK